MTKLQEKAQAQVKQIVGQMIGDQRLEQEGREQQQKADQSDAAPEATTEKQVKRNPAGTRSKEKR
jgi:uncharacterized protein YjbJ (UPF0337 family)